MRLEKNPWNQNRKYSEEYDKIPRLDQFLKKYSKSNQHNVRNKVIFFFEWIRNNTAKDHILKIQLPEVEKFFDEINQRKNHKGTEIKLVSKEKWRTHVNSYYKRVEKDMKHVNEKVFKQMYGIEKSEFINPVPDREMYQFSTPKQTLPKIQAANRKPYPHYKDALKILNYFYFNKFDDYIAFGLIVWTGARIQEIVSIEKQNLDIQNHFFFNLLKKTTQDDTYGVYFFPEFFIKDIKLHIEQQELIYPGDPYLFPSPVLKGRHVTQKTIREHIKDAGNFLKMSVRFNPHSFRTLINSERKRKGVDPEDRSILLNHGLGSMQAKSYLIVMKEFLQKKEIYDDNFPFPEFKPNPNYMSDY